MYYRWTTCRSETLWAEEVEPAEIHCKMTAQYGNENMSQWKVYEWIEKFKERRTRVTDKTRSGRPSTSPAQAYIDKGAKSWPEKTDRLRCPLLLRIWISLIDPQCMVARGTTMFEQMIINLIKQCRPNSGVAEELLLPRNKKATERYNKCAYFQRDDMEKWYNRYANLFTVTGIVCFLYFFFYSFWYLRICISGLGYMYMKVSLKD